MTPKFGPIAVEGYVRTPTSRAVQTVLDALESRNCHPKKQGNGWSARCPAHDDRQASLSIGQGGDGRPLLHCHAGCGFDAILFALGLDSKNLFAGNSPRTSSTVRGNR